MRETWLRTNCRALWFGTLPPLTLVTIGIWLVWRVASPQMSWTTWLGVALIIVGSGLATTLVMQMRQPRVSYDSGQVLFHLRSGPPIAVPVEMVEAFFLGQGPLVLPGAAQRDATVNLVARISQRDPSYAEREVKPALGRWSESYVTIRGTWCEPLNGELIRRLNHRLREVSEERARQMAAN